MLGENYSPRLGFLWSVSVATDGEAGVVFADRFAAYDNGLDSGSDALNFFSRQFAG